MKAKNYAVYFVAIGLSVAAGWCLRAVVGEGSAPASGVSLPADSATEIFSTNSSADLPNEADLLNVLRAEITALRDERAVLEKQILQLAVKGERYDYIYERAITPNQMSPFAGWLTISSENMSLSPSLLEYLGLDESEQAAVSHISQATMEKVRNWEKTNAVVLDVDSSTYTAELPPYPGDMQSDFRNELTGILSDHDAELVSALAYHFFKDLKNPRMLEVSIYEENGHEMFTEKVTRLSEDRKREVGSSQRSGTYPTSRRSGTSPFPTTQRRWEHLYRLDDGQGQ